MANNTLSIQNIVNIFRDLALDRHQMIKGFGFGDVSDLNVSKQDFPLLWIEPVNSNIVAGATNLQSTLQYSFNFYCYDRISKGDSNYLEVISDTALIINTIIADFKQSRYYQDVQLHIEGDVQSDVGMRELDANTNGWVTFITFKLPFRYSTCNIPITPTTGYTYSLNGNVTSYRILGGTGAFDFPRHRNTKSIRHSIIPKDNDRCFYR